MIPNFQECMLPTLQVLADGKVHRTLEIYEVIKKLYQVTPLEQKEMLPSKRTTRFLCNMSWARTYMKAAGLIYSPSRGNFAITKDGLDLLATHPKVVNKKTLEQYDKFNSWSNSINPNNKNKSLNKFLEEEENPEEQIARVYNQLRNVLAQDLLDKILEQSPKFFEELVIKLLVEMGYGGSFNEISEMVVGKSGDEGIDGIIKEDKLGLDNIYIQAKRWAKDQIIGRPEIQKFVGALSGQGANKGIFITTARFSEQAKTFKPYNNIKVALIDGESLCQHMIDYNIGVSIREKYEVKRIDLDFFSEDE
ncbi:MAG: restriction endonuclease [Prevotella sp.]|nr:restriction endonuclease [Prevotella sp.]